MCPYCYDRVQTKGQSYGKWTGFCAYAHHHTPALIWPASLTIYIGQLKSDATFIRPLETDQSVLILTSQAISVTFIYKVKEKA